MSERSPEGEKEMRLERINYGKLASGPALSISPREGYGVTRRSRGLDPAWDAALSPSRLVGVRRVEPDLIEQQARARGGLIARAAPHWPSAGARPFVLLRTRFRHEDGDRGQGRLYLQTSAWLCDFDSWRRRPDAALNLAGAQLEALPDLAQESETARFQSPPLRGTPPVGRSFSPTGAAFLRETLMRYGFSREGCVLTFGAGCEFRSEADYLATVGAALRQLPPDYPRWPEISVLSGVRHSLPGICLRFLPSYVAPRAAA
jgi:hypothetical protein